MNAIQNIVDIVPGAIPFALDVVLRATLLLLIVKLALVAMPRASAASRHFVLSIGMVALVALPLLMLALPDARLEVLPSSVKSATSAARPERLFPAWKTGDEQASSAAGVRPAAATPVSFAEPRALRAVSGLAWIGAHWRGIAIVLVLAAIPLLLLGRLAFGLAALGGIARRATRVTDAAVLRSVERARERLGVSRDVRLLLSDEISVPVVWGLKKATMILPIDAVEWSRERLRVVLLHEMAHVRRADVMTLFMGRIATSVYWFHPLAWLAEHDARRECERACDDLVLEHGARASEYAHHLLGIASGEDLAEGYASVSLAMARPSELEGRLIAILRAGGARQSVSRRFATAAAVVAAIGLLPIATVRLAAKPVTEAAPQVQLAVAHENVHSVTTAQTASRERVAIATSVENAVRTVVEPVEASGVVLAGNGRRHKEEASEGERWYVRGMEMHNSDRYDQARAAFEKAIELDFKPDASAYNIACGYALQGDAGNTVKWLDRAIEEGYDDVDHIEEDSDLDPVRSDAAFRGLIRDLRAKEGYRDQGSDRVAEARERIEELRRDRSTDAGEWADAATDLLRLRELDASIDAYGEAIRISPDSATSRYNLACAYALKGDRRAALDAVEGAILNGFDGRDKLENDPDLKSIRGEARFKELLTLNDKLSLWSKEEKLGNWNKEDAFRASMPRFEEAVRLYPQAGRAWFNLGFAALATGDTAKAKDAFGRCVSLGYRRGVSMYNLACAEARSGNKEAAFDWLRKSEETGFDLGNMDDDEDLESLQSDPRFDGFLERAWKNEEHRNSYKYRVKSRKAETGRVGSWDAV